MAPDSDAAKQIDAALKEWRQGDLALEEHWFVHVGSSASALSEPGAEADENGPHGLTSEVEGLVVVTQTCDVVRSCMSRPFVEVAPLVQVSADHLHEVQRGRRPSHATLPSLEADRLVADLDKTRAQWQAEGLDLPARHRLAGEGDCTEPECPVTNVSFFDAVTFANRYSEQRDLEPCYRLSDCSGTLGKDLVCQGVEATAESVYACEGYRLPTEAEWEYATRAGTRTAFFTGPITVLEHPSVCAPEPSLEAVAWYCCNSDDRPHPAGQKAANPWGLHDLAGNVFEWCNDIYSPTGYGDGPVTDPTGMLTPTPDLNPARKDEFQHSRVLRGGNHVAWAAMAKSGKRFNATQTISDTGIGLRLARTLRSGQKVSP